MQDVLVAGRMLDARPFIAVMSERRSVGASEHSAAKSKERKCNDGDLRSNHQTLFGMFMLLIARAREEVLCYYAYFLSTEYF